MLSSTNFLWVMDDDFFNQFVGCPNVKLLHIGIPFCELWTYVNTMDTKSGTVELIS